MTKLCECGCGEPTPPAKSSGHGYTKGEPLRYVPSHAWRAAKDTPRKRRPLIVRFMEKVERTDACWEWRSRRDRGGYGEFRQVGKTRKAHRIAYELFVGPIPTGLTIDHLCRNRGCVNPAHLEAVTPKENYLRGEGVGAIHARRTHCREGHALEPAPEYMNRNRWCPTCHRRRDRERARRKRAERLDATAVYFIGDTLESQHTIDLAVTL